ncbi:MAG: hypothetical protein EXR94_05510 [Gemmatimonadetes bacterium]|nr:hypothetical protein [Gemmatimonadota bacterium]
MVNPTKSRRGASMTGYLGSLVVTIIPVYYGMQVGRVSYRFYAIKDKIDSAALFAQTQPTEQILRNLREASDETGIPPAARNFQIRRTDIYPRTITISTVYTENLNLPFVTKTVTFKPTATHSQ